MAQSLHVSGSALSIRHSSLAHSLPPDQRSSHPLRPPAALSGSSASSLRQPPAWSAIPSRVRQPVACRPAAEAAGLASFPWANDGDGGRGAEEEWGRGEAAAAGGDVEADVVVVGAGVVGLVIADALLASSPDTRVVVIDSAWPCAGATGAGQGYIWMGHRQPGSKTWQLAAHSKQRWEQMTGELEDDQRRLNGCNLGLGRLNTGSILVPSQASHNLPLQHHHEALLQAGLSPHLLSPSALAEAEPALRLPPSASSALLLLSDWQLDAQLAVHVLLSRCRQHLASGRYVERFQESVSSFIWSAGGSRVVGVATDRSRVMASEAVVVATGSWSSGFIAHALLHAHHASSSPSQPSNASGDGNSSAGSSTPGRSSSSVVDGSGSGSGDEHRVVVPHVRPRKGFLLQVQDPPSSLALRHGLMEFDYTANYAALPSTHTASSTPPSPPPSSVSISMTATSDHHGHLLLGSSRELAGFSVAPHPPTIAAIVRRAALFLPALVTLLLPNRERGARAEEETGEEARAEEEAIVGRVNVIRTGLRPYVADGRPFIGPVDSLPGVLFALGHEGSGLLMAPGTADIIMAYLGRGSMPVDPQPFQPKDRLASLQQLQQMRP